MEKTQNDIPDRLKVALKNGEQKDVWINSWHDHVMERHEIESFTTIIGEQLFHVTPKEDEVMIPYIEINGDHNMNWILGINAKTSKENWRKNTRSVDMVNWKLSSSETNPKKNGKK